MDIQQGENLAQTLARELPKAEIVATSETADDVDFLEIFHVSVPKGSEVKTIEVDLEKHLAHPRRTKATASFSDIPSFMAYVKRHALEETVVWCDFNPQTFPLKFKAVFDEHAKETAGWRQHSAVFVPDMSTEWKAWTEHNGPKAPFNQVEFAEWIQEHEDDIASANGLPTSLQMLEMATNFVMNEERILKSAVRLQSGGTRLTYIADPDAGTVETMQMFERFGLGIPVFQGGPAWSIGARLKYRQSGGKVIFFYELIRPDRVHEGAARELIKQVEAGLEGLPVLLGTCN